MAPSELLQPEYILEQLVKQMVDRPDSVLIDSRVTDHAAIFDIYVDDSDIGKTLGVRGEYADALRSLFGAIYGRRKMRLLLQVIDPRR